MEVSFVLYFGEHTVLGFDVPMKLSVTVNESKA
jgi:hypothetical protein